MAGSRFDFAWIDKAWTWSHRVDEVLVRRSAGSFATLGECMADARTAGFHADVRAGDGKAASGAPGGAHGLTGS